MPVSERRAERTQEILAATRALFDERGVQDAQIEDVARAVGINRAIIYRHFSGKEELFAMTLVGYLEELADVVRLADASANAPTQRLVAMVESFLDFGHRYPAFVDCATALMRRRGSELMSEVGETVMVRLGQAMNGSLSLVVAVLREGMDTGEFDVEDADLLANLMYAEAIGVLNLATLRMSVRERIPGLPTTDDVEFDAIRRYVVTSVLSAARTKVA